MDTILLFNSRKLHQGEGIYQLLHPLEPSLGSVERHASIEGLRRRLHQPKQGLVLMVMIVGDEDEFLELLLLRHLLFDLPLILMLPDRFPRYINLVFKLRPRYVDNLPWDCRALLTVVKSLFGQKM